MKVIFKQSVIPCFMLDDDEPKKSVSVPCADCSVTTGNVLRCACGSMLARYVGGRIELKCRRCKRTLIVPVSEAWDDGDD